VVARRPAARSRAGELLPFAPRAGALAASSAAALRPLAWPADDRVAGRLMPPPGQGPVWYPGGAASEPTGQLALAGQPDGADQW